MTKIGAKLDFDPIERGGEIALQAFLVMYLMSLKLWLLGAAIGPLLANVLIQILVTASIGVLLLFRWLGRDYDAAVTCPRISGIRIELDAGRDRDDG